MSKSGTGHEGAVGRNMSRVRRTQWPKYLKYFVVEIGGPVTTFHIQEVVLENDNSNKKETNKFPMVIVDDDFDMREFS